MCTSNLKFTQFIVRHQNSSALKKPSSKEPEIKISRETIAKLERLSLVDFGNEAGIKRLEAAIKFAEQLRSLKIDDSIKPMYCVLENENLRLRHDKVTDGNTFLNLDRGFVFGPQGKLLRRNLENLWFQSNIIKPFYNVFLTSTDKVSETLENLKTLGIEEKPLGIAIIEESKNSWNTEILNAYPKLNSHRTGKVTIITNANEGKELYHKTQRERKIWWRKLSREPSRFKFTDSKKLSKNKDTTEITVNFEFGSIVIETITHQQDIKKLNNQIELNSNVHIIEHKTSLDWGSLALLCDAYDPESPENPSQLKLNPKLSPYKVGFHLPFTCEESSDMSEKKRRFMLYLNNLLRSKGIETIFTTSLKGIKSFQVPLIITVDDTSLQNGIIQVWNQLTTLAESVHITELPKYILSRCN
ncbi:Similar to BRAFLDRAFT_270748: Glutamyl-tRNA(Gln) amidotransferase subunit C [Cotesia congregata]|uniref:Mitochondrial (Branchiostoma floridae) n=1 Tax=Cotesia congregata TaxID=51543 RepID=A0A8J2HIW9_COTCN|nr:Similar to BRAFLDRAFT_270748: Glutamyl-tRNA(Gln) amidotransferase subunit C [Cotesia congregata]